MNGEFDLGQKIGSLESKIDECLTLVKKLDETLTSKVLDGEKRLSVVEDRMKMVWGGVGLALAGVVGAILKLIFK